MALTDDLSERRPWVRRLAGALIAAVVAGAAVFGAYYFFFAGDGTKKAAVTTQEATAAKGQLVSSLTTTGTAQASLSSKLMFQASGQVKSVSVIVGQQVTAGQELARLDDKDAKRKLESALSSLNVAKLKLQQLLDPPKASDLASAQQSVAQAQGQVASAQSALDKALNPAAADLSSAQGSVAQAEASLANAESNVTNSWTSLLNAQRTYCQSANILVMPCYESDLPLTSQMIHDLTEWIRAPGAPSSQVSAATTAANSLLQANSSWISAKNSVEPARKSLESAQAKLKALTNPDPLQITQLQAALASAQAGLVGAQARLDTLLKGATASDIALQQESVRAAQINYDQAQDTVDNLVLKAPFAGTVGTLAIVAGDQVGATTAVMTLTNPDAMRVDLTISETDLAGLKAGLFGVATFDALSGQVFLLKVTGVSNTPTVSQGVVTYPAQAQILRGAELAQNAQELLKVSSALQSLGGSSAAGRAVGGTTGTPPAGFTRTASGTPGAQGTPGAGAPGGTPGASGTPGSGGSSILQRLQSGSLPTAGMNASVIILLDVKADVLLIPSKAIKRTGQQSVVTVIKSDGTQEQRTVTVNGTDGTNSAIASGLSEGEKVLIGGTTATASRTTTTTTTGFGPGAATPAGGVR